jgi:thymidylate kinase
MWVAVEGPDLAGKTTACDAMRIYGFRVVTPWGDLSNARSSLTSISRTLFSLASRDPNLFLMDRFITSELVYGPLLNRRTEYLSGLLSEWAELSLLAVYLIVPDADTLAARYQSRGDHLHTMNAVLAAREAYLELPKSLDPSIPSTIATSADPDGLRRWICENGWG